MLLVGLTGGIGSGKSTVSRLLAERGAIVIDADAIYHELIRAGAAGFEAVVAHFGMGIVGDDGEIDRPKLAEIVFADEAARSALNDMTHPLVGEEMMRRVGEAPSDAIVVMDIPLLAEGGKDRASTYPAVIVVEAPAETRVERLVARGMDADDARARMGRQASDDERREIATHVIDNSGDLEALEARVDAVWADLSRLASDAPDAGSSAEKSH